MKTRDYNWWDCQRFKDLYRSRGFTQASLAQAVGVSSGTVSTWSRLNNAPNDWNMMKLSIVLDISLNQLRSMKRNYPIPSRKVHTVRVIDHRDE